MDDRLKPWLELARDAYSTSTTYFDSNIRSQVEKDLRAFQSLHAPGSKYLSDAYKARSRIFRPKTRTAIRKNEAIAAEAFFSTKDVVSCTPGDESNPLQRASAQVMQALLQHRLSKSIPWFHTCIGAYQDAMTVGMVASYQSWKYNEKRGIDQPSIELIPIENIRFDQAADWTDVVDSSPYLIRLMPMYVRDVTSRMRTIDPKTNQPKWFKLEENQITKAVQGYTDSIRSVREGNRQDSREPGAAAVTAFSVVWVHQNFIRVGDDDWVYYTLGTQDMLSVPQPIETMYWHGRRPFVIGSAVLETHKNYPASIPQLGHQLQTEINEIANQRIDNVKFVLNKRYFVARNRQVDVRSLTRNVPGSATFMQDVEKDVKVVDTPDVSRSAYEEQDRLNVDYDDVVGGFSQSSVQSNRNLNETVGGLELVHSDASQVGAYQLRTFVESWVEPVLEQLVLLEQEYETDLTIMSLAGTEAEIQKLGFDEVTDEMLTQQLTVDVNVGIGATSPAKKVSQFLFAMRSLKEMLMDGVLDTYGLDVAEVVKEIFGNLGYRDGTRFFQWDEEDPTVAVLKKKLDELQKAADAKMPPALLQKTLDKMDAEIRFLEARKVGQGVDSAYSAMQGAEVIAAIPAVAPVADEIMRGAGYINPTPPGIDPNFPILPEAEAAIAHGKVGLPGTGLSFQAPGGPEEEAVGAQGGAMGHSPNPMNPMPPPGPESPGAGRLAGIQTQRPDEDEVED
jgi:hypothetical protein